ncbi:MAG TPA: hypothetical protein VJT31_10695 [Rugosimonospora sp.]|nr:hypothetical protein [Rugosimonospora sp.]
MNGLPEPVAYVRDLLAGIGRPWFLCGGWAVDAWLGRQTREHGDVDIAVFHHDQHAIIEHLPGWALVGHDPNVPDDTTEPWRGRHLDMPAHIHVPILGSPLSTSTTVTHSAFEFEFLLNEGTDQDWILNRGLDVALPRERGIRHSPWALPTATPEAILFFKAGGDLTADRLTTTTRHFRYRDQQDFVALRPTLTGTQRGWLRESIGTIHPEHPWLVHLES